MPNVDFEVTVVIADELVCLNAEASYDYYRGSPATSGGRGEPPESPAEPERVEITAAWVALPMTPKPAGSPHKPTFQYNLLPLMSQEQLELLELTIMENHE